MRINGERWNYVGCVRFVFFLHQCWFVKHGFEGGNERQLAFAAT